MPIAHVYMMVNHYPMATFSKQYFFLRVVHRFAVVNTLTKELKLASEKKEGSKEKIDRKKYSLKSYL